MIGGIGAIIFDFVFIFLLLSMAFAAISAAPWVPSRSKDLNRILKLADIKKGEQVYDLGCGDAKIVCAFAKEGANAVGFEASLLQYFYACLRMFWLRLINNNFNAKIKFRDFWNEDLRDADVVYIFLMQRVYPKLKQKLEKELKKGSRVIVYVWPIEGLNLITKDQIPGRQPIYLYKM